MELFAANNQWSTRPDDERFASVADLRAATYSYFHSAKEIPVALSTLRVQTAGDDVVLTGKQGVPAKFSHYAFGQLCRRIGAPADYMRALPAALTVENLNHGLARASTDANTVGLFHQNGSVMLRAITSDKYARIWNWEVADRLAHLEATGWKVPPARPARSGQKGTRVATAADVLPGSSLASLGVKVGDKIAPAGLYASDHDMFAFMVNESSRIADGSAEGLARGFFVSNSEVGAASFKVTTFLYRYACGNHIVWGASGVREIAIRHVGSAPNKAWANLRATLTEYADESASDLEAKIAKSKEITLGASKDDVLDAVFGLRIPSLTRKAIAEAYDRAEANVADYGSPRSAWGMVQGLTETARDMPYADDRVSLDVAAGKLLDSVF